MPKPAKIILVCNKQRPQGHPKGCCTDGGAGDITMEFNNTLEERKLLKAVSLVVTGCLGPCSHGPIVVVMPDNTWYRGVARDNVGEIVDSHIIGGKTVERLVMNDTEWE